MSGEVSFRGENEVATSTVRFTLIQTPIIGKPPHPDGKVHGNRIPPTLILTVIPQIRSLESQAPVGHQTAVLLQGLTQQLGK